MVLCALRQSAALISAQAVLNNADMNQEEIQQDLPRTTEAQPLESTPAEMMQLRPIGLCAGEFVVPDDFDAPLPDWLLDAFEGKENDF